jgi:succinyl-CoA synthetase beta subunit
MWLSESVAKQRLAHHGVRVPLGRTVTSAADAAACAASLNTEVVVKAHVPAGQRGKSGGVRFADTPAAASQAAADLLGSTMRGFVVNEVLVEERVEITSELFAAVTRDPSGPHPIVLFSAAGGIDIEEAYAASSRTVRLYRVDISRGLESVAALQLVSDIPQHLRAAVADVLMRLYRLYRATDAELVEINPLALMPNGETVALDCKLVIDDSALARHPDLATTKPGGTALERRAGAEGLLYLELEGDIAVLANGAGLTMATLDAIVLYGGRPANFMEIGGSAYRKAPIALSIALAHPGVRALLVNLCGAYARTDVIIAGLLAGWRELQPNIGIAFSIHGTGEEEAIRLVRTEMGMVPHAHMDAAVQAVVKMAAERPRSA